MRTSLWFGSLAVGLTVVTIAGLPTRAARLSKQPVALAPISSVAQKPRALPLRAPNKGLARAGAIKPRLKPLAPTSPTQAGASLSVVFNGQVVTPLPMPLGNMGTFIPAPGSGAWFNLSIFVPATGQDELFILGIPSTPASVDVPMVVGFRSSNVSHGDVINHTTFWDECLARGWYLLAPLSRGIAGFETVSGPTLNAQINTEAALEWVTDRYPIDMDRIYGVGFSAGGATLASYASRHLDPRKPMFAALAIHTAPTDLIDSFNHSNLQGKTDISTFMGGAPTAIPFEYRRIGSLQLDAMQLWLAGGEHAGWNLRSIPTQIWYATNDSSAMLVQHTTQLFDWMNLNGNAPVSLHPGVSTHAASGYHSWDVLDETVLCNWFATQTRTAPLAGTLRIDRNARYHYFDVEQDAAGAFSRMEFELTLGTNKLALTQTENVERLTLSPADLGLYTLSGVYLTLELEAVDNGDEIVLKGLANGPMGVTRDGIPNTGWTYSGLTGELTIPEIQTGTHNWVIHF